MDNTKLEQAIDGKFVELPPLVDVIRAYYRNYCNHFWAVDGFSDLNHMPSDELTQDFLKLARQIDIAHLNAINSA